MAETVAFKYLGDEKRGKDFVIVAEKQLGILKADMAFQKLTIGSRKLKFDSGIVIDVGVIFGAATLTINVPPGLYQPKHDIVTIINHYGDVVFTNKLCADDKNLPAKWLCSVGPGKDSFTLSNQAPANSGGSRVTWRSLPDKHGDIDIVSYGGPESGYGLLRVSPSGEQWHASQGYSQDVWVNGEAITYSIADMPQAVHLAYTVGIIGACIRIVRGVKYLVIVMANSDLGISGEFGLQPGAGFWDFTESTYVKEINYEALVYYAEYRGFGTEPDGAYHKDDNPFGWRFAGYTEKMQTFPGGYACNSWYWHRYLAGVYHFSQDGNKMVSLLRNQFGQEYKFNDGWTLSRTLYDVTNVPIRKIYNLASTDWYDRKMTCSALDYVNNELVGIFQSTVGKDSLVCDPDTQLGTVDGFCDQEMFFYTLSGDKTTIVRYNGVYHQDVECNGSLVTEVLATSQTASWSNGIFSGTKDTDVRGGSGVKGYGDFLDDDNTGPMWADVPRMACSFCAHDRATGRVGLFASVEGSIVYSYVAALPPGDDSIGVRKTPSTTAQGNNCMPIATSDHAVDPDDYIPQAHHAFALVGSVLVGNMLGPTDSDELASYYDPRTMEQIEGWVKHDWVRLRSGLLPKSLEDEFVATFPKANYEPSQDCYALVYVFKLKEIHEKQIFIDGKLVAAE